MKSATVLLLAFVITIHTACAQEKKENEANYPSLEDRYFGAKPPGLIPQLFAPEIISPEGLFEEGTYSPDMRTFYWSQKEV